MGETFTRLLLFDRFLFFEALTLPAYISTDNYSQYYSTETMVVEFDLISKWLLIFWLGYQNIWSYHDHQGVCLKVQLKSVCF